MAGAQTPLQREVSESMNTSEAIRAETLRILEQSNEMLRMAEEKGADTTEIRKRLEAVRQTTIYALKDIVVSSNNDRAKITEELSDGKIDGSEIENIKEEYNELKGENDRLMASLDLKKLIDIHIRDGKSIDSIEGLELLLDEQGNIDSSTSVDDMNLIIRKLYKDQLPNTEKVEEKKVFDDIFNSNSAYIMGIKMHSFAINTFNAENEADFEGFFDQRLLPYIKDNPAAASIFLQAWGTGELGQNNIRSGLKRCEVNKILPQIRQIEMENKLGFIIKEVEKIYTKEEAQELEAIIQKEVSETGEKACTLDFIKIISEFDTKHGEKIKKYAEKNNTTPQAVIGGLIQRIIELKQENTLKVLEEILIKYNINFGSTEVLDLETVEAQLRKARAYETEISLFRKNFKAFQLNQHSLENATIISSLNNEEYTSLLAQYKNGEDPQKVMESAKEAILKRKENELSGTSSSSPQVQSIQESGGGEYTITTTAGESIEVTEEEKKDIENHPEALKNVLNFRNIVFALNIPFVWQYRSSIISALQQAENTTVSMLDGDNINQVELLQVLNFTLKVIGKGGNASTLSSVMGEIRSINSSGIDDGKKDALTGLSIIGTMWKEKGYLRLYSGLSPIDTAKLMDTSNWSTE